MRILLVAVPHGGGEAEYSLGMECPAVPNVGDYITVMRNYVNGAPSADYNGTEDFIVRRIRWQFTWPDTGAAYHDVDSSPVGEIAEIVVECEMAIGAFSSTAHKRNAGENAPEHEASGY